MAIESELISEALPLPRPKRLSDPANSLSFLLRSTIGYAEIDDSTGEITLATRDLERLDSASPTQLASHLILAQEHLKQKLEAVTDMHQEAVIKSIGAVINAILELYKPVPAIPTEAPKKPKGPNNPYAMGPGNEGTLSYHPGAMKSRSSHHR